MVTTNKRLALSLLLAAALAVSALLATSLLAGPAFATNIGVTTTEDEDNADGDCSLREAIIAANTNTARDACTAGSGTDIIGLSAGTYEVSIPGTIPGTIPDDATVGDLDITGVTIVSGAGARATTIEAQPGFEHGILENTGTTTISGLTITGANTLGAGGGARNNGGALTLRQVTVTGNVAENRGGGIDVTGGSLSLIDSTVSGNETYGGSGGGGVALGAGSEASIVNSTISDNRSLGTPGGGIQVSDSSALSIESSTIASNSSSTDAGGIFAVGNAATTVNVKNTIISDNAADDCLINFSATISSGGHNISGDGSCGLTRATDQENTDPLLGPLDDNGGPTDTHTLLAGSPTRDAGDSDQPQDQRGKSRPQDGDGDGTANDDIGALERGAVPPPPNTAPEITPLNPDPGSAISDRTPQVRARVTDAETNLRKENIKLFVDGARKRGFDYDRSKDKLTFTTARLTAGKRHTEKIEATDGQLDETKSWRFRIRSTNR